MSGAKKIESGASRSLVGASRVSEGPMRALRILEDLGLFDPWGSLWSLLLD